MTTKSYIVTFTDGGKQELANVYRQYSDKEWLVFQDEESEILRVPAKDVKSVTRSDMPSRQHHAPRVDAI